MASIVNSFSGVSYATGALRAGREYFRAQVAAGFGPFVVLLGQDGADEPMIASRLGKMPTTSVRLRISLLRRSWGLSDQTWRQTSRGKAVKGEDVVAGVVKVGGGLGELGFQGGDDLGVPSAD
jgi:hypothetical protein